MTPHTGVALQCYRVLHHYRATVLHDLQPFIISSLNNAGATQPRDDGVHGIAWTNKPSSVRLSSSAIKIWSTSARSLVRKDRSSFTVDLSVSLGRLMGIFPSADKQSPAQKSRSLLSADTSRCLKLKKKSCTLACRTLHFSCLLDWQPSR